MRNSNVRKLAVSAMMLALGFALSYAQIYKLPWGGAVTLLSALPICFVSIKYGLGWGLGTAFCFSWLQIVQSGFEVFSWGLTPGMLVASLLLDYIVAFTVLGFAGILRRKGKAGPVIGVALACVLRFLSHFAAGYFLWANYEEFVAFGQSFVNRPALYSVLYNGAYMLPETILTVVGAALLFCLPQLQKLMKPED